MNTFRMKTKIFNIFMLLAVALGFAACNDDTEPVLSQTSNGSSSVEGGIPQSMTLEKAKASETVFTLSWEAPTYNLNVAKSYRIEISNVAEFTTTASVAVTSATTYAVTQGELNEAVLEFMPSVEDVSETPVYLRIRCELNDDPEMVMVVGDVYNFKVTPYPGEYPRLYVVGSINGWDINTSGYFLRDTEGNNVFTGRLGIPAGGQFRFYKELGNWDTNSIGSQVDDAGVNITVTDGVFETTLVEGKGSWIFPADAEGTYNCTVDLTNMTARFEYAGAYEDTYEDPGAGEEVEAPTGLFMVGNINGWSLTPESTQGALTETSEGSNVWNATLALPDNGDGYSYFRFYTELNNDWDTTTIGAVGLGDNENQELTLDGGVVETELEPGSKGSFMIATGTYNVTVDLNDNLLVMELAE